MSHRIDLSISIASYNTKQLVVNCLDSIFNQIENLKIEVLLADNGSKDGTPEMMKKKFPQVKLILNNSNLFFTKAHNQNLKRAKGKYFLVLNTDTKIPPHVFAKMLMFMESHPKAGLASCRQIDEKKIINITSERFPHPVYEIFEKSFFGRLLMHLLPFKKPKQLLDYFRYIEWDRTTTRKVDVIPGSFFLGRRVLLDTVGYFDENLLLFYEESDYCQRAAKQGYHSYHVGNITIVHLKSRTLITNLTPFKRYQIAEQDMLFYYKKYFGPIWWLSLWVIFRPNWIYWKLQSLKN